MPVPLTYPDADAVMFTASGPSSRPSSMIVSGTDPESCPAEMTTVAGTESLLLSLEVRLTVRSLANATGMLTVPATVPTPSVSSVGTVRTMGGKLETVKLLLLA